MTNAVRQAAVRVLDEAEEGLSLEEAIDRTSIEAGCDSDQARMNLLIVSEQDHSSNGTTLSLSSEYNAEEFLENDVSSPAQHTLAGEDVTDQSPADDEDDGVSDISPGQWQSESFDLDDLDNLQPAPMPSGDTFKHADKLEDVGHELVPEAKGFIDQEHRGGVTEMEHFTYLVDDASFGVMIEGEPGTAKGTMVKETAAKLNVPMVRLNMGVSITKEKMVGGFVPKENGNNEILQEAKDMAAGDEQLTVGKALDLLGAKDQFEWKDGIFTLAFRRGWWILVDEINAAEAETLMPFFGALEEKGDRSLELTEPSESIEPHPNFRFIATMNPPHHQGTHRLNDALKDRCHHMEKDYLPQEKEADLIEAMSDVDISPSDASSISRLANHVREAYPQEIDQTLTPRGCKRIAEYTDLYDLEEAAKEELLSRAVYDDTLDALERAIETVMSGGSSDSEDLGELFG